MFLLLCVQAAHVVFRSRFGKRVSGAIQDALKDVPRLNYTGSVSLDNVAAKLGYPNPERLACDKNYSSACPEKWRVVEKQLDDGTKFFCSPPGEYTGSCKSIDYETINTPTKKFVTEGKCNVQWPCIKPNSQAFEGPCPEGWESTQHQCRAPADYLGPCKLFIKKAYIPEATSRETYSNLCKAFWPDKYTYNSQPCPTNWSEVPHSNYCAAPAEYAGPCTIIDQGRRVFPKVTASADRSVIEGFCRFAYRQTQDINPDLSSKKRYSACPIKFRWDIELDYCIAEFVVPEHCLSSFPRSVSGSYEAVALMKAACGYRWNESDQTDSRHGSCNIPENSMKFFKSIDFNLEVGSQSKGFIHQLDCD